MSTDRSDHLDFVFLEPGRLVEGDLELVLVMYGGHLGYSVLPGDRCHRYAARCCALLLPLAREHGLSRLWITCNPDNVASRRTCEILGAELVETVDLPENTVAYLRGERQKLRYKIEL